MTTYGYLDPGGTFQVVVETGPGGIRVGRRRYAWDEVRSVSVVPSGPHATVMLRDGTRLRVRGGDLVARNRRRRAGCFGKLAPAYLELLGLLDAAVSVSSASAASKAKARSGGVVSSLSPDPEGPMHS
jgi:hypothetical protein